MRCRPRPPTSSTTRWSTAISPATSVKPGITGWAQINGWRGETDTLEKIQQRVEHDLYYIENWSVLLDLYILFETPFALLSERERVLRAGTDDRARSRRRRRGPPHLSRSASTGWRWGWCG